MLEFIRGDPREQIEYLQLKPDGGLQELFPSMFCDLFG